MHRHFNPGPGRIEIDVPGTAVRAGYLYWSGFGPEGMGDNSVVLTRESDGHSMTLVADPANGTFGPALWYDGLYYHVYVAEVSSLIMNGPETYVVSDFDAGTERRDGAGLIVVYQDDRLPLSRVVIRDGLDRFFRGWGEGPRGESAVNCADVGKLVTHRSLEFWTFAGEVVRLGEEEPRPNALWYLTGSGPKPDDLVNAPSDGPVIGQMLQGPPGEYPFRSSDGPQWDTYRGELVVPPGDDWVCVQVESAVDPRDPSWRPASGISLAWVCRVEIEGPTAEPTAPPTDTPVVEPTVPSTPGPTNTPIPLPTKPGITPPVVPEGSTLLLLSTSSVTLAGYAALQWRARRRE
jgi:hypothetical protein